MKAEELVETKSYLSFKIGDELFAAHVSKVINILELTKITKIPQTPEYMLGVINLRGTVLPVVDARLKFGIPASDFTSLTCIIVTDVQLENESVLIGVLVDSVQEVLNVELDQIKPPPGVGNKFHSEYIKGIINVTDEFILLLDIDNVFASEGSGILSEISSF